ncbi:MAG TPA: tetratricopeptide repeat protein [Gemmatimonadaceae bacterium]
MSNVAKLKKQAAEFEQKKQFDKALAVYVKLLGAFDEYAAELDVALFNRVGDLMLRQGNVADALDYYEQAVDRYSDTGFFNNAIALCNKILRASPGRASIYYKLGKISAQKGFKNDAKVNFLEYADRMQKGGNVNEAFRALKEFADLCPDQDEIRLMLADQLTKADRKGEAIEQLQILYARYQAEGRGDDATAVADRIHQIDPSVALKLDGGAATSRKTSDLIFLDLDAPVGTPSRATISIPSTSVEQPPRRTPTPPRAVTPPRATTPAAPRTPASPLTPPASLTPAIPMTPPTSQAATIPSAPFPMTPAVPATPIGSDAVADADSDVVDDLTDDLVDDIADDEVSPMEAQFTRADIALDGPESGTLDAPLSGISRIDDDAIAFQETPSQSLLGLESTQLADDDLIRSTPSSSLLDIEPTALGGVLPVHRSNAPTQANREETALGEDLTFDMPPAQPTPIRSEAQPSIEFGHNALLTPLKGGPAIPPRHAVPPTPSPLDGLPLMDLDVPIPPTPATSRTPSSLDEITLSDDLELLSHGAPTPSAPLDVTVGGNSSAIDALDDLDIADESDSDDDLVTTPTPPTSNRSTLVAIQAVEALKADVEAEPTNWARHRELAEAMLEAGERNDAILELETAMTGAERAGDLELASALAEELARLEPESVKHHQKRVEYAFRTNNRPRLIEAYLSLGDSLLRADQTDKARTVYQRVIDLAPDEIRARAALDSLDLPLLDTSASTGKSASQEPATITTPSGSIVPAPAPQAGRGADFVNLGDWLRDASAAPKDTRMVVAEQEPTGDEEADFADMLRKFKQGVAENVDAEDYQSHYDLAIAFKEMGLLDEAISEFQKALGSPTNRLPTYEALGQCFLEKSQPRLAMSVLARALTESANEEQLIGVLYLLGRSAEELGLAADALVYYQRVFVQDIQFRDISERMSEVERAAR